MHYTDITCSHVSYSTNIIHCPAWQATRSEASPLPPDGCPAAAVPVQWALTMCNAHFPLTLKLLSFNLRRRCIIILRHFLNRSSSAIFFFFSILHIVGIVLRSQLLAAISIWEQSDIKKFSTRTSSSSSLTSKTIKIQLNEASVWKLKTEKLTTRTRDVQHSVFLPSRIIAFFRFSDFLALHTAHGVQCALWSMHAAEGIPKCRSSPIKSIQCRHLVMWMSFLHSSDLPILLFYLSRFLFLWIFIAFPVQPHLAHLIRWDVKQDKKSAVLNIWEQMKRLSWVMNDELIGGDDNYCIAHIHCIFQSICISRFPFFMPYLRSWGLGCTCIKCQAIYHIYTEGSQVSTWTSHSIVIIFLSVTSSFHRLIECNITVFWVVVMKDISFIWELSWIHHSHIRCMYPFCTAMQFGFSLVL